MKQNKAKRNRFRAVALMTAAASVAVAPVVVEFIASNAQTDSTGVTKSVAPKTFSDIPTSYMYYNQITEMAAQGIINGHVDGSFKPNDNIERRHAAALVSRALELTDKSVYIAPTPLYSDVPVTHKYFKEIQLLGGLYNLTGFSKVFEQSRLLTRGEMAKILTEAFELPTPNNDDYVKEKFTDVSSSYRSAVGALHKAGITTGYQGADGKLEFRENETLTRAHYAVFMKRAFDYYKTRAANEHPAVVEGRELLEEYKDLYPNEKGLANFQIREFEHNPIAATFMREIFPLVREKGFVHYTSNGDYGVSVSFLQPDAQTLGFSYTPYGDLGGRMTIKYTYDDAVTILKETLARVYPTFNADLNLVQQADDYVRILRDTDTYWRELKPSRIMHNGYEVWWTYQESTTTVTVSIKKI